MRCFLLAEFSSFCPWIIQYNMNNLAFHLQVRFSWMRQHYKTCKKYQDEYGVSSIIPNLQISQDSTGNR